MPRLLPIGVVGVAVVLTLAGCDKNVSDRDITPVTLSEVRRLMERSASGGGTGVLLLDPRSPTAFAEGHLPGARNLQLSAVQRTDRKDPELAKFDVLIVYGQDPSSAAARALTKRLLAAEYRDVRFFAGGLSEWTQSGFPLAQGEGAK